MKRITQNPSPRRDGPGVGHLDLNSGSDGNHESDHAGSWSGGGFSFSNGTGAVDLTPAGDWQDASKGAREAATIMVYHRRYGMEEH